ncbi:MAG: TlyA family RNA methyltransferase [Pseudomonadota bacterium]
MTARPTPSTNTSHSRRTRLDQALVDRGLAPSRSRARDMILRGCVSVDGKTVTKSGHAVCAASSLTAEDAASGYVSRAALKLLAGLNHSQFEPRGRSCIDLGASTGGFTQVLLERGAARVCAIDVGHGQFHESLRGAPEVTLHEGQNARHLGSGFFANPPEAIVSDLSFISLRLGAEPTLNQAAAGAWCILLVKPQFELGPAAIGKGGLVIDPEAGRRAAEDLRSWLSLLAGWRATGLYPSPILGGDGNREYLLCGVKDD